MEAETEDKIMNGVFIGASTFLVFIIGYLGYRVHQDISRNVLNNTLIQTYQGALQERADYNNDGIISESEVEEFNKRFMTYVSKKKGIKIIKGNKIHESTSKSDFVIYKDESKCDLRLSTFYKNGEELGIRELTHLIEQYKPVTEEDIRKTIVDKLMEEKK